MAKKQKLPDDEKATQDIYQESAELEEAMEIKEITTHKEEEITTHKEEEITAHKEEEITAHKEERPIEIDKLKWVPRTKLGQLIKNNKISVNEIFSSNLKIMESEIIDIFFPEKNNLHNIKGRKYKFCHKAGKGYNLKDKGI